MNSKTSNIYPWVIVGLLWGVALLNYMDRQMLSTMRIPMMADVRELESAANFGRLMAVFLWVYGLMSPISGIIGDRMSRKWLIVGSLCVWSGVTYLMGYATTFDQLYWLRGIMGISEALYLPAAEMGLEHHLGLTCDPVCGLVQIPCIERNAFAAARALDANTFSNFSDGKHRVSFDQVVEVMRQTGNDLPSLYKETSEGGLAKNMENSNN